jgi:hypothetical protein
MTARPDLARRGRIAAVAALSLLVALSFAMAPIADGAKKRKKKAKVVRFAKTKLRLLGIAIAPGTNPQIAAIIKAVPRKRGCISNRQVDLHVRNTAGVDRIAAVITAPPVGKDATALVGASFPVKPDDVAFYLDLVPKQAGKVTCGPVRSAVVAVPLPGTIGS